MRVFFISVLCVLAFIGEALAGGANVTVVWDVPPNPEWGTKIYIGTTSGTYENTEDAGTGVNMYNIDNLQYSTQYYLAATHYYDGEESDLCNEITWISPDPPVVDFNPLPPIDDAVRKYHFEGTLTVE